jgi:hypothetical protein
VIPRPVFNENVLRELTLNAIKGDRIYNDSLSGLIDYSLPLNSNFNDLKVDKIISPINKTFYEVLLENPNPVYNRFAVYDSALHLILMDKSLNGNVRWKSFKLNNLQFIEVDESFLTLDVLKLNRISLYKVDSTVSLDFRTFTKFMTPTNEYYQTITEISPEQIKTNITSLKKSILGNKSEIISLPQNQNNPIGNNSFVNFIEKQVAEFKRLPKLSAITDETSALQSVGISKSEDTIKASSFINSKYGYYLTIDEGWKEIIDISLTGSINKLKGNKYYNPLMGTNIFIARLPENDSAETFVDTRLSNITQGKYKVRFTGKIEKGKFYVQYFEFSCGKKKFLMVFEASKFTYDKYKAAYQDIINSFVIEC